MVRKLTRFGLEIKKAFLAPLQTGKEFRVLYGRVVDKIRAMTPLQRLATMERAGIYTKSGKLTKQYGG